VLAEPQGDQRAFHKYYEMPILRGREPDASDKEGEMGMQRSTELSTIVNQFILRRTNALLSQHLPPKVVQIVCCKMTGLQEKLYRNFLQSKVVKKLLVLVTAVHRSVSLHRLPLMHRLWLQNDDSKSSVQVLPLICNLKKLCNHPKLLFDSAQRAGTEPLLALDALMACMLFT